MDKVSEKKGINDNAKKKIVEKYKEYKLTNGEQPNSVYAFVKEIKIKEDQFFDHFSSFNDLEGSIWEEMVFSVIEVIQADENYLQYSIREKLLTFYFTFLEVLKSNRSFVLMELKSLQPFKDIPVLKRMKHAYIEYISDLMVEGNDSGEIPKRPFISEQYKKGFWVQMVFLMNFWKNDDSKGFESTDAAVEKSVHLSLDLIEKGPLDSMLDFAKFLYQNKN